MSDMRMLVMALAVLSVGCASTSTMGLARTLNKGAVQGWAAIEGGGVVPLGTSSAGVGYPMVEGGVRFGATDHVELGARLGFNGIGLEGKFGIVRSPTTDQGLNLSLNPQVGFFGLTTTAGFVGTFSAHLPVLIGIDFGGHELVFGPRLSDQVYFAGAGSSAAAVNLLSAGASLGFAIKLGSVRLMPEVSASIPFLGSVGATGVTGATGSGVGGLIFQAGIGILFGSAEMYDRVEEPLLPPPGSSNDGPPPPPPPPPSAPPL